LDVDEAENGGEARTEGFGLQGDASCLPIEGLWFEVEALGAQQRFDVGDFRLGAGETERALEFVLVQVAILLFGVAQQHAAAVLL